MQEKTAQTKPLWIGAGALALIAAGAGIWMWSGSGPAGSGVLPYRDAAAVADGRRVYTGYCASCHGSELEGEPDWQQRDSEGYLPAPPHDETGHTWHHPDQQLIAITMYGSAMTAGGGYKSRMEGYSGVLSDQEILNVLAYIKSTWPGEVIKRHNEINAKAG